jgi:hypothetical protein
MQVLGLQECMEHGRPPWDAKRAGHGQTQKSGTHQEDGRASGTNTLSKYRRSDGAAANVNCGGTGLPRWNGRGIVRTLFITSLSCCNSQARTNSGRAFILDGMRIIFDISGQVFSYRLGHTT